tara:strand:+ start:601 stop:1062 length:462 start_codon:yes stop_codon:yes gene_type:complete
MAFTGNFMCTSFKQELLVGGHNFTTGGDVFKIALYSSAAAFTAVTTDYTASNEVGATGSAPNPYVAGGGTLTNVTPTTINETALVDFNDITFTGVTLTAAGALIYNTTEGGGTGTTNSVIILDFGPGNKTATAGDFQIIFPVADATQAIIRIA